MLKSISFKIGGYELDGGREIGGLAAIRIFRFKEEELWLDLAISVQDALLIGIRTEEEAKDVVCGEPGHPCPERWRNRWPQCWQLPERARQHRQSW